MVYCCLSFSSSINCYGTYISPVCVIGASNDLVRQDGGLVVYCCLRFSRCLNCYGTYISPICVIRAPILLDMIVDWWCTAV